MRLARVTLPLAMIVVLACGGSGEAPTPTVATAPDAPTATSTTATQVPSTAVATPTATAAPPPPEVELQNEPRETVVDRTVAVPPRPPSPFEVADPRDGRMRLYDIEAGTVTDYGPGSMGEFSPDGRWLAWTSVESDSAIQALLDLDTGRVTHLGSATLTQLTFATDPRYGILFERHSEGRTVSVLDLTTLERRELVTGREVQLNGVVDEGALVTLMQDERRLYDLETGKELPVEGCCRFADRFAERRGDLVLTRASRNFRSPLQIEQGGAHGVLLRISGLSASFAAPREIIATSLLKGTTPADPSALNATLNLYLIDVDTAAVIFVATVDAPLGVVPFAANERYVVWAEGYCFGPGTTRMLDRASGEIVELDFHTWVELTPAGLLGTGDGFGALALLDLETLEYVTVLPIGTIDVRWSPDYRYATTGETGGHGGNCGS